MSRAKMRRVKAAHMNTLYRVLTGAIWSAIAVVTITSLFINTIPN